MKDLFDGFIFDIDGTLTYTNQLIFDSFNFIAKKYLDRIFSDEEIISMFGPPENDIIKQLCGEKFEEAKVDYYNYYKENHSIAQLYPGIKEILELLKSKNFPLGIFTGKGREASMITLKYLDVHKYFNLIVTGDDVNNHKPSAEGIFKFVNQFNLIPDKILMIGDSVSDVKAAKEAGVKIASALWDSYGHQEVKLMRSNYYFYSVEELNKFLFEDT